jgi:hypothetical protein
MIGVGVRLLDRYRPQLPAACSRMKLVTFSNAINYSYNVSHCASKDDLGRIAIHPYWI